ncbi:MAG: hypothetical protein ACXV5Q_12585 [Frankiaceae bacterium]
MRLDRVSAGCRRLVQAAAIAGWDFPLGLVAATLDEPIARCLPLVDEAVAHGLLNSVRDAADYRFVHGLTRDAVEASLTTTDRIALHRAIAQAIEVYYAGDLSDHLADLARHWGAAAPFGEAATARRWAVRAAADAVRRLAYQEGARLYRSALAFGGGALTGTERGRLLVALAGAANLAGDLHGRADAARAAADAARAAQDLELLGEAAPRWRRLPTPG